ncbi:Estradiol 17-beta-dehydrogenase 8, partial [Frankliniella fusca]
MADLSSGGLLRGRVALVTGAGSGIGRSTCVAMAREGAGLVLADINESSAAETLSLVEAVPAPGPGPRPHHLVLRLDVTDEDGVDAALREVRRHFGQPADVLVNSAGIMGPMALLLDLDVKAMRDAYKINVEGTFLVMRAFARALKEAGRGGAVVNLSSVGKNACFPRRGHYAATKGAVSVLTQTASREWAPLGIRVNAVLPGLVDTPMTQNGAPPGVREEAVKAMASLGRMAQPEDRRGDRLPGVRPEQLHDRRRGPGVRRHLRRHLRTRASVSASASVSTSTSVSASLSTSVSASVSPSTSVSASMSASLSMSMSASLSTLMSVSASAGRVASARASPA